MLDGGEQLSARDPGHEDRIVVQGVPSCVAGHGHRVEPRYRDPGEVVDDACEEILLAHVVGHGLGEGVLPLHQGLECFLPRHLLEEFGFLGLFFRCVLSGHATSLCYICIMRIPDQYNEDPTHAELFVLLKNKPQAKEMLKSASFDKASEEALPSSAFAWPEERRFPIHTKHDTVASILYRTKLGSYVPKHVDENLSKATDVYGITEELFVETKVAAASKEEVFALEDEKQLPLNTVEQIKVAQEVLCEQFEKLPLEKRAIAFSNLEAAATKHKVPLTGVALKLAGLTKCAAPILRNWLEARAAVTTGDVSEAFDKLASAYSKVGEISDRKHMFKLAETIATLDKVAGLEKHYDRKLPDPILTVFNTTKLASDLMCDVGGVPMSVQQLMGLPGTVYSDLGVPELAELSVDPDPAQFKAVFDTMPLDIKVALRGNLSR